MDMHEILLKNLEESFINVGLAELGDIRIVHENLLKDILTASKQVNDLNAMIDELQITFGFDNSLLDLSMAKSELELNGMLQMGIFRKDMKELLRFLQQKTSAIAITERILSNYQ